MIFLKKGPENEKKITMNFVTVQFYI
jgi:hypothetical protein